MTPRQSLFFTVHYFLFYFLQDTVHSVHDTVYVYGRGEERTQIYIMYVYALV